MIPLSFLSSGWLRYAAVTGIVAALFIGGCEVGEDRVQAKWDAENKQRALDAALEWVEREQINSRTATEYAKKTTAVAEHTSVITKLVPIYVPATVDPSCNLPGGFRVLHNTAVTRTPPLPVATGGADGAAVTPQEVASTVVENYNACHLNATKLEALQGWVREQLKVSASATLPN